MRAAWAWMTCLAAALTLGACGKSAPSSPPTSASSASATADYATADPAPADETSNSQPPEVAASTPAVAPPQASSEPPLIGLAPPVRLDPGKLAIPPSPALSDTSTPAPVAGARLLLPSGQAPLPPPEIAFTPRDECADLPGWKAFRDKLGSAVASKNASALAAIADRNVKLDYGGGAGRAELIRRLRQRAGLWRELATILPLGCSVEGGLAALPWFFWRIPPSVDPTTTMLVTGEAVPLRAAPKANARIVAALNWPMVVLTAKSFEPATRFTRVRTRASGQDGYVETQALRSLLAQRIIAEHVGDAWRITAIVAGD